MTFYSYWHRSILEELSTSWVSHWERTLKAVAWFPLDFTHTLFPFADFALCLCTVTSLSHEYDYTLSLPSESLNLRVVLGIPDTLTTGFELKVGDFGGGCKEAGLGSGCHDLRK